MDIDRRVTLLTPAGRIEGVIDRCQVAVRITEQAGIIAGGQIEVAGVGCIVTIGTDLR